MSRRRECGDGPVGRPAMTIGGALTATLGGVAFLMVLALVVAPRANRFLRDRAHDPFPEEQAVEEDEV